MKSVGETVMGNDMGDRLAGENPAFSGRGLKPHRLGRQLIPFNLFTDTTLKSPTSFQVECRQFMWWDHAW